MRLRRLVTPRAGERCFVPVTLWPRRTTAVSTRHGTGWLATVAEVRANAVRLQCDGQGRDDELALPTFRRVCALVAVRGASAASAVGWPLDADALDTVLAACDLAALLALEVTHRAALLAVRAFWRRHRWAHDALAPIAAGSCAPSVDGRFLALGAVDKGRAGVSVWRDGAPTLHYHTRAAVTVVAVDATGTVAWTCATERRRAPISVASVRRCAEVRSFRPCFATALVWSERGTLLIGERGRLVEWREGRPDRMLLLRTDAIDAVVTALAVCNCIALAGWGDGAVHTAHVPPAPLLHAHACHGTYRLREPCGAATRAVAVDAGVCAAALHCCVDVWADKCANTLRLGATVTALCLHGGWLLAGVGAREGRVEVWEPLAARCVGVLAGCGAVEGLAVAGGAVMRTVAAESLGEGLVVLHSHPPMVLY